VHNVNSKNNVLIAVLALTTVIAGSLAWHQYQRASTVAASTASDNDGLLKKLADAERRAADLEARLAALATSPASEAPPSAPSDLAATERRGPDRDQGPNNNRRAEMMALMNNPEVQRLMAEQQKAQLDGRYATLFKQLNLSPAQLEAFKNLLLEKQNSQRDVMMAARESGLNPRENREELQKLVAEANAETDAAIAAAIGQEKFSQYQNYDATSTQRALVEQLNRTMSYSATPLTDSQSQALVQILAQGSTATDTPQRAFISGGFPGQFGGSNSVKITDEIIAEAQTVLAPAQVKVLQEQQATQQAEQKLRELMRPSSQAARP
jgi:hypothetical protein